MCEELTVDLKSQRPGQENETAIHMNPYWERWD
jgi:hypothetical protein